MILPKHISFIPDGNGRWASEQNLPRTHGHRNGIKVFENIFKHCCKLKIPYISFFVFSLDNWKRPKKEIDTLFSLLDENLDNYYNLADNKKAKVVIIGNRLLLPENLQDRLNDLENKTKDFNSITIILAINYSGRWDILNTIKKISKEKNNNLDDISFEDIENNISTTGILDPCLLIRTSGEYRISDFFLWQLSYTELYFTDCFWPDFNIDQLDLAIKSFQKRKRKFGGVSD